MPSCGPYKPSAEYKSRGAGDAFLKRLERFSEAFLKMAQNERMHHSPRVD